MAMVKMTFVVLLSGLLGLVSLVQAEPVTVTFDDDGGMLLDGVRTFVYGTYRDPSDDWRKFDMVKKAGFNLTHSYHFETGAYSKGGQEQWIRDAKEYLTLAEKAGVGVFLGLPREVVGRGLAEELVPLIESVRDYKALWFWYLVDEPGGKMAKDKAYAAALRRGYEIIKAHDENHPVVIVDVSRRIKLDLSVRDCADTFWIDRYSIPYSIMDIKRDIEIVRELFPDKVIWGVPEGGDRMSHIRRHSLAKDERMWPRKTYSTDDTSIQQPEDIRATAHACIAADVHGVIYWWGPYYWHNVPKGTPKLWQAQVDLGKEFATLHDALMSKEAVEGVKIEHDRWGMYLRLDGMYGRKLEKDEYPEYPPVAYWLRKHEGSIYVGLVSDYFPVQRVTIHLPFDYKQVVQYEGGSMKKVVDYSAGKEHPDVDFKAIPATVWNMPDRREVSVILNPATTLVWRFDPLEGASESDSSSGTGSGSTERIDEEAAIYGE